MLFIHPDCPRTRATAANLTTILGGTKGADTLDVVVVADRRYRN
jgi:hypothetical protein